MEEEDKSLTQQYIENTSFERARVYRITRAGRRTLGSLYLVKSDTDIEKSLLGLYGPGTYAVRLIKDGKMTEKDYYYVLGNISGDEEEEASELTTYLLERGEFPWSLMKPRLSREGLEASIEDFIHGSRAAKRILNEMSLRELKKVSSGDVAAIIERETRRYCIRRMRKMESAEQDSNKNPPNFPPFNNPKKNLS